MVTGPKGLLSDSEPCQKAVASGDLDFRRCGSKDYGRRRFWVWPRRVVFWPLVSGDCSGGNSDRFLVLIRVLEIVDMVVSGSAR